MAITRATSTIGHEFPAIVTEGDANGESELKTGYPSAGLTAPLYVQYAWAESASSLSASDALRIK